MGAARAPRPRAALLCAALAAARAAAGAPARAETPAAAAPQPPAEPAPDPASPEDQAKDQPEGFMMPSATATPPALVLTGYLDVGFANAGGDGTSFAPGDNRVPADYGVDPFAPAVNSRGDVASIDPHGRFTNGFLPRSVNIDGRPSFLINTVDQDLLYRPAPVPLMVFVRLQALPRWGGPGGGNHVEVLVDQAFGRVTPFEGRELHVSAGKLDSVLGIEYLDSQASYRTGITPSLMARYTTGTAVGLKAFFREPIAPLWSAVSLNVAATNGSNFVEPLQPTDVSLTGVPLLSGRLGYELDLPRLQVKLGASGMRGPRNDQLDHFALLQVLAADARIIICGLSLAGEVVRVDEEEGAGEKQTGAGESPITSAFHARGFWAQAAYALTTTRGPLRALTPYVRYEQRHAWFEGFRAITVARVTVGLRAQLWTSVIVKGERLVNQELAGAPPVDNDVLTTSVVYLW
jgi:hypothetical protein